MSPVFNITSLYTNTAFTNITISNKDRRVHTHIINTTLLTLYEYIIPTYSGPQTSILREYGWYISIARPIKWVTSYKIQLSVLLTKLNFISGFIF
jgi:hypothetical protein